MQEVKKMRITDPEIIRTGERDLIDSVKNDLDWDAVKNIIKNRLNMKSFESKGGEIIVLDGKIAFKIDLELKMAVSLMFDRDGNYIESDDKSSDIEVSGEADSLEKFNSDDGADDGALDEDEQAAALSARPAQNVDINQDNQVEKHDLEFGLPDFTPQADGKKPELTDDVLDIGSAVPGTPAADISDKPDSGSNIDSDFDLGFDDDLDNLGLEEPSDEKSGLDFYEEVDSDEENDTFDNDTDDDIDDDIDDILEETRELWKQKKE